MTRVEKELCSKILSLAATHFSGHICNDYILEDSKENRELLEKVNKWSQPNNPEQIRESGGKLYIDDWLLMKYLAKQILS